MEEVINDLRDLFGEARQKSEFDFVLTLINYTGIGAKELSTNLHEWFDAIEFYKELYNSLTDKKKTRIGTLLYSAFFENSDFYNIIGSLCRIKLGYKGSSFLFWKTKKYERLLGIGEKQDFLMELLEDAEKPGIITFFSDNHFKEIRNTFFHSAYSLTDEDYILHDSEAIVVNGIGTSSVNVNTFLYPKIDNVILMFDAFRQLYTDSFNSYKADKEVIGLFPNLVKVTLLGSPDGLKGFRIKNAVQFYDQWHDSGIWYDERFEMWAGRNINMYFENIETIEIRDQLTRYENKTDIVRNDQEFKNLIDKIAERKEPNEIIRATQLLVKFGNIRYQKMIDENNPFKKKNFPKIILPYYQKALEIGAQMFDVSELKMRIKELENN